jgi:hypothetical protein
MATREQVCKRSRILCIGHAALSWLLGEEKYNASVTGLQSDMENDSKDAKKFRLLNGWRY